MTGARSDDADEGLLERERELSELADLADRLAAGKSALILVEGVAGIGKTVLLDEARRIAESAGVTVLIGRGGELERDLPYGVVRQLFEPLVRAATGDERRALLAGAAGRAAPIVAPGDGAERAAGAQDDAFAVLHGLYWLTATIADRGPTLIVVDDAHWADPASLRFFIFLARRLAGLPVGVLVAARPGEADATVALIDQLAAQPGVRRLELAPLSVRAIERVVHQGLGRKPDAAFVAACRAATGGNPFLLGELVRALAADGVRPVAAAASRVSELGPDALAQATLLRLRLIAPAATSVAQAVAVLGSDARFTQMARLAGIAEGPALEAVDRLTAARILTAGTPLEFVHPIVRTAVYGQISPARRSDAHARAAELLAGAGARPDEVAAHLLATEPAGRAETVQTLREAAAQAGDAGLPADAAVYLARALAEPPEPDARVNVLLELGVAQGSAGDPAAVDTLEQALALARDAVVRAHVSLALSGVHVTSGRWEAAVGLIEPARADLGDGDPALAMRLDSFLAAYTAYDTRLVHNWERRAAALRAAIDSGAPGTRAAAALIVAVAAWRGEDLDAMSGLIAHGLDGPRLLAEQGPQSPLLGQAATALIALDQQDALSDFAGEVLRDGRATGSVVGVVNGSFMRMAARSMLGDLVRAEADLRLAFELSVEHRLAFVIPSLIFMGLDVIDERAGHDDLVELALNVELEPAMSATLSGAFMHYAGARMLLRAGQRAAAIVALRRCGEVMRALQLANPLPLYWRSDLALALGREQRAEALVLAESQLEDARRIGDDRAIGVALRVLGVTEGGEGGLEHLNDAVALLATCSARLEHARALVELGAALRRGNRRAPARTPLRAGLDLARRCGATRTAERARAELAATGARVRREAVTGLESLTPSERRVAELAATGASNPEIAQALFITRNTVETHLRHAYQKLKVRRRSQLPAALAVEDDSVA